MVDQSRRRLFKATLVSGSSMVVGGSVNQVAAHQDSATDHLRPDISGTIEFLSSIYSLEALLGRLYAARKITLLVFMNEKAIEDKNALDEYVQENNITLYDPNMFQVIFGLRNGVLREQTSTFILEDQERAKAASNLVDNLVRDIFRRTNSNEISNEVVATTIASLHHYERIVVANNNDSENQDQPWICHFFPFSYFCSN